MIKIFDDFRKELKSKNPAVLFLVGNDIYLRSKALEVVNKVVGKSHTKEKYTDLSVNI